MSKTKGNPADVRALAEDLHGVIQRHPDAITHNADLRDDIVKLRDKAQKRYSDISEKPTSKFIN